MEKCGPLLKAKLERAIDREGDVGSAYFFPAEVVLQQGPTCGFASLVIAAKALRLKPEEKVEIMVEWAKDFGFTKQGEMFSGEWLAKIGANFFKNGSFEVQEFPSGSRVVEAVNEGRVFLVPYDCDRDFAPIHRGGEGAHWAAVVGYFVVHEKETESQGELIAFEKFGGAVNEDELHVIAYQGKSRHGTLWKYNDLKSSNNQLKIADTRRETSFMLPASNDPENGQLSKLRGQVIQVTRIEL